MSKNNGISNLKTHICNKSRVKKRPNSSKTVREIMNSKKVQKEVTKGKSENIENVTGDDAANSKEKDGLTPSKASLAGVTQVTVLLVADVGTKQQS